MIFLTNLSKTTGRRRISIATSTSFQIPKKKPRIGWALGSFLLIFNAAGHSQSCCFLLLLHLAHLWLRLFGISAARALPSPRKGLGGLQCSVAFHSFGFFILSSEHEPNSKMNSSRRTNVVFRTDFANSFIYI